MADLKITDLTAVTTPTASDLLEIVSGAASKKIERKNLFYGTQTNDDAAAGRVGEEITAELAFASRTSLTNATAKTIVTLPLTAGDWDVVATLFLYPAATTAVSNMIANVSLTTNTLEQTNLTRWNKQNLAGTVTGQDQIGITVPRTRVKLAAGANIYLVGYSVFSVSTMEAFGVITARRPR